jgi:uncharacterized protein (TIGR02453 family)
MRMPAANNLGLSLDFLTKLGRNNNKAWFDANRPAYEAARDAFYRLIDGLIDDFRGSDQLQGLAAKDCVARIYRDIRFSKDKSPYKTNLAAMIAPGGWKTRSFGYYVSVAPGGQSLVAGGLYDPAPGQLERFRREIDRDAAGFKAVTSAPEFIRVFGAVVGDRLKTAPKGYDQSHPEIALLQLKQITVIHHYSDAEVLEADFQTQLVSACQAMKPFLNYMKEIDR